jgi:hypothetical protein
MAGKTTSAGYRLPMATSSYHEKCIATSVKAIKDVSDKTSDKTYSHGAYRDCNVVAQERIWSEYVQKELKQAKIWYIGRFVMKIYRFHHALLITYTIILVLLWFHCT